MHGIIPVIFNDSLKVNSVDARTLYRELESKQKFTDWIKSRLDDTLATENVDFIASQNYEGDNKGKLSNRIDYIITIDIAKHIAMLEKNEKGREVRKYFIECEKQLLRQTRHSPLTTCETFKDYHSVAQLLGLQKEQAALHANIATRKKTGEDVLALLEYKPKVDRRTQSLTRWLEGQPLSARKANLILEGKGILAKDASNEWILTASGADFGKLVTQEINGKMRTSIEWTEEVLKLVC